MGHKMHLRINKDYIDYFTCEGFGIDSNDPCILNVDRTETLTFTSIAYFGHAMGPYATLIFIFPINKIREKINGETRIKELHCHICLIITCQ